VPNSCETVNCWTSRVATWHCRSDEGRLTWKARDQFERPGARRCRPWVGRRRVRCACSRTTSTRRSPNDRTTSSSTAAPARGARLAQFRRTGAHAANTQGRRDDAGAIRSAGRRLLDTRVGATGPDREFESRRRLGHVAGVSSTRSARSHDVRTDDRGSWIYIGTQGIVQGTYETFSAVADRHFGGTLKGTLTLTAAAGAWAAPNPSPSP